MFSNSIEKHKRMIGRICIEEHDFRMHTKEVRRARMRSQEQFDELLEEPYISEARDEIRTRIMAGIDRWRYERTVSAKAHE